MVILDTETSGTRREIYSDDANGETRTRKTLDYKPSALAIELQELKSYWWEGVEFIQLVYCIIIYLSFVNCD